MLKWGRENASHYSGGSEADNMYKHWQYVGAPPVSRIIDGVVNPDNPGAGTTSWMKGCHGVAKFFASAFRAANIPVEYKYGIGGTGHGTPMFTTIGHTMSHGDDLYAVRFNIPSMDPDYLPPQDVLITYEQYNDWFFPQGPEAWENVGRRPLDIALDILPNKLLDRYCDDIQVAQSIVGGSVYGLFNHVYSIPELANLNLWERLEQKRAQFDYCPPAPDCGLCHSNQ
ncbi:MAG: hypothetical protein ACN4GR_00595 [Arenicellales bacterium]